MVLDEFEGSEHFSQETRAASCFERRVLFDTAGVLVNNLIAVFDQIQGFA